MSERPTTAEVARAAHMTVRRLAEWARDGTAVPSRASLKQGSGARWSRDEAEVVQLLATVRRLAKPAALAELGRALRRGGGRPVHVEWNGALRVVTGAQTGAGPCLTVSAKPLT